MLAAPGMSILVDADAYPFVLQRFPRGPKGEAALAELFDCMAEIGARALRDDTFHVVIALGDEEFTAPERRSIAMRMRAAPPAQAARVVGAYAVIENAFARGVLTALRWLAPSAIPVVPAATPDAAIDLAEARLRKALVRVAPDVELKARVAARRLYAEHVQAKRTGR